MGRPDRISGIFWLIFAVIVCIESRRLGLGALHQPGPGFLSFWVGAFLGILSLIVILRSSLGVQPDESQRLAFLPRGFLKTAIVMLSILLYGLLMERIGFLLATLMLFILVLGIVERKRWAFTIFSSLAVTAGAYLIFQIWLKTQLPHGILNF